MVCENTDGAGRGGVFGPRSSVEDHSRDAEYRGTKTRWTFLDTMEEDCLQWSIIGEKGSQFIRMRPSPSPAVPSGVFISVSINAAHMPRIGRLDREGTITAAVSQRPKLRNSGAHGTSRDWQCAIHT